LTVPTPARVAASFARLREEGRTGFIPFLTAGDPSLAFTEKAVASLDRPGVAAIEIGIPFSDPLADGPTIQRSSERALAAGVRLSDVLSLVRSLRSGITAPIVLMSYMNPILRLGMERFAGRAARAGVDALIATDLPMEEAKEYRKVMKEADLGTVFLAAPTSPPERVRKIARASTAFLYYVSLTGVTGERKALSSGLARRLEEVRSLSPVPVSVGFGISTPAQAKGIAPHADAVVMGSALVHAVEEERSDAARLRALGAKVDGVLRALSPGTRR